ncbi:hypothetical protein IWQ57_003199 [Coemansia nantahalensis]|uniref:Uncharacterized protein n=1 Tax=Coemansia nantahalensis TaxID=2789366 RepID=A0ACC1JXW9_9FUNG|nr:hypothetical protein IWQ57_003199 [Coemansia nantahalensis]
MPELRMARLRDTRGFAQLSQFLHTFHSALGVERVDLEWLEAELSSAADEAGELAGKVLAGALRILVGRRVDEGDLAAQVERAWARHGAGDLPHGFSERGFAGLGAGERVQVVLGTCELATERAERLQAAGDAAEWRVRPSGHDDVGRAYWVLCGTQLYRQTPRAVADQLEGRRARRSGAIAAELLDAAHPPQHSMREADGELWELLCSDERDWRAIAEITATLRTRRSRALSTALTQAAAAAVQALARERRREPPALRKRSSRLALRGQDQTANPPVAATPEPQPSLACSRDRRAQRREQARLVALESAGLESAMLESARLDSPRLDRLALDSEAHDSETHDSETHAASHVEDEEDWMFACLCGARGQNYDDGRAMTACERCAVWQHLGCALRAEARRINRPIEEDDWESIRYICAACRSSAGGDS